MMSFIARWRYSTMLLASVNRHAYLFLEFIVPSAFFGTVDPAHLALIDKQPDIYK